MNIPLRFLTAICVIALLAAPAPVQRPDGTPATGKTIEWRDIGGDKGSTRYSPIDQITAANVHTLTIAWRRPVVAEELRAKYPDMRRGASRATPVIIGGVLYAPNAIGLVEAFEAASGRTVWIQQLPEGEPVNGTATRAVAQWSGGG